MDFEISIIIDSNALHVKTHKDYNKIGFLTHLNRLISDLELTNLKKKINVIVPDLVARELLKQQEDQYKLDIDKFSKVAFPDFRVVKKENYDKYLMELLEKEIEHLKRKQYKTNVNFSILYGPYGKTVLPKTIDRALTKKTPFEGKEKESDKGFKDVMIWEAILEHKVNNPAHKIIFVSNDKIFNNEDKRTILTSEYMEVSLDEINFTSWYPGVNDSLFKLLSEISGKTIFVSQKAELLKRFEDIMKNGNLADLYKRYNFFNSLDNGVYFAKSVNILNFNYLSDPSPFNDCDHFYFVVELHIEVIFVEVEKYFERTMTQTEFSEFEINYYPSKDQFSIIGFDGLTELYESIPEFFLQHQKVSS